MVDLDSLMYKPMQFKLEGKVLNVNQPSAKDVKMIISLISGKSDEEIIDGEIKVITSILNNNTSNMSFTEEYVSKLPQPVLTAILEEITKGIDTLNNNPN